MRSIVWGTNCKLYCLHNKSLIIATSNIEVESKCEPGHLVTLILNTENGMHLIGCNPGVLLIPRQVLWEELTVIVFDIKRRTLSLWTFLKVSQWTWVAGWLVSILPWLKAIVITGIPSYHTFIPSGWSTKNIPCELVLLTS